MTTAPRDAQPLLHFVQGDQITETIEIGKGLFVLGRDQGNLIVEDAEVSTTHCQIQPIGADFHIFDLNSTNGTFVNGQRIVKARLTTGDRIRIGQVEFLFEIASHKSSASELLLTNFAPENIPAPSQPEALTIDNLITLERKELFVTLRLQLDVTYSDGSTEILTISAPEFVVGRLSTQGNFNKDDELSRTHARLFIAEDGNTWVEDLGSTNGVLVNDVKIDKRKQVIPQDVVHIGRSQIHINILLPEL